MINPLTDALSDALELARNWRAHRPSARPAYEFEVPAPRDADNAISSPGSNPVKSTEGAIAAQQILLQAGEVTSLDLVDQSLAAIARRNDELYAFVEIMEVEARELAMKLDAELSSGRHRGALHGIPVSVKDLFAVRGGTTHAGSIAYEMRDRSDAAAVRALRESGAVIVGKTAMHEFAMGVTSPQSRNPQDSDRIAGGSSSGAAIAVACGMGMAALGTDTRGSIRIPAALCGVVGLKPTYGTVSLDGVLPLSWTMDHAGVIAQSVADAAQTLDAIRIDGPIAVAAANPVAEMRVGLPRAAWAQADADVEESMESALAMLAATGAELVDVDRPSMEDFAQANLLSVIVSRSEAAAFHRDLALDQSLYSREIREQLDGAGSVSAVAYIEAQRARRQLQTELLAVFDSVDALLMPTVPIVAPLAADAPSKPLALTRNVAIWSFVGFPAISVPSTPSPSGLPIGFQVVAAPHAEATMIAVGRAVERGVNAR